MNLSFSLSFNGNCEDAFRYYEKHLGGKIQFMKTWGDTPMAKNSPPGWDKKLAHISMTVAGQTLIGGDSPNDWYQKPQGSAVCINIESETEADRIWKALADGGKITMAMDKTFWAKKFGMLTDRFGTNWMINCGQI